MSAASAQNTQTPALRLFRSLVLAARRAGSAARHSTMHHSNANPDNPWDAEEEECFEFRRGEEAYRLQIRLEASETSGVRRVVIFGRRHAPRNGASDNTQRATFNSNNYDPGAGYWIRPHILKKNAAQRHAFASLLPAGTLPDWNGQQFQLGIGPATELLERFLFVLRVVEQVKSAPVTELAARFQEPLTVEVGDFESIRRFREGAVKLLSVHQRQRCKRQLDAAREYHRQRSPDGQLHCAGCDWTPPVPVRAEIVQIHHVAPLQAYPKDGKSLSWAEAIANLQPLCPNCHRMVESHPDGGHYSLSALRVALADAAATANSTIHHSKS